MSLTLAGAGQGAEAAGVASSYATAVLADSPVGYWRLNETTGTSAADSGSGGNAGTYTGSFTLGVAGNTTDSDKAVTLAGTVNSMITIPSTFPTLAGVALSIDMWMKTAVPTVAQMLFGAMNPSSPFQGWGFGLSIVTAGALAYWNPTTGAWRESTTLIADTNWHHVALTVPAAGSTITFYIDGAAAGTASSSRPTADANAKSIGAHRSGTTPFGGASPGTLDEVAVYSTELTAGRIAAHFAAR